MKYKCEECGVESEGGLLHPHLSSCSSVNPRTLPKINDTDLETGLCLFKVLREATPEQRESIATYLEELTEAIHSGQKLCKERREHCWQTMYLERGKRFRCIDCHLACIDWKAADKRLKNCKEADLNTEADLGDTCTCATAPDGLCGYCRFRSAFDD
jgi:hypothetical protein